MNAPNTPAATRLPIAGQRKALWRNDRGAATVETVFAMPLILLAILAIAQTSMWLYAANAAQTIATQSLDATRVQGGTVQAGQDRAADLITQLGHGALHDPRVSVTRDATTATVTLDATAPAILPGLRLPIHTHLSAPVEHYTLPGAQP